MSETALVGDVPCLSGDVQHHLGAQLALAYVPSSASEPPAAFLDLIAKLTQVLAARDDEPTREFRDGLIASLPHLRAFAISLAGSHHRADDLVQETMLKALHNIDKFEPGTNLQGWLFAILRNQFYTEFRKRRREVEDPEGLFSGRVAVPPEQPDRVDHVDLCAALAKMPPEQREVLILIGAEGKSYEEMATICDVPIGTIKSRVNRARARLAMLMELGHMEGFGLDGVVQAALAPKIASRGDGRGMRAAASAELDWQMTPASTLGVSYTG